MKKLTRYRLEACVQDVTISSKDYLVQEIKDVLESNKPYQSKADYIGYSLLLHITEYLNSVSRNT